MESFVVICRADREERKPGRYLLATRLVFPTREEAEKYRKSIAVSRQPIVVEGRWNELSLPVTVVVAPDLSVRNGLHYTIASYPHEGNCHGCSMEARCNYCGRRFSDPEFVVTWACTNGRCSDCHRTVCTAGGSTSPGHAYGKVGGGHFNPPVDSITGDTVSPILE